MRKHNNPPFRLLIGHLHDSVVQPRTVSFVLCEENLWCEVTDALEVVESLDFAIGGVDGAPEGASEDGEGGCEVVAGSLKENEPAVVGSVCGWALGGGVFGFVFFQAVVGF